MRVLAVLGKRMIHPGGRHSTNLLLEWTAIQAGERVLDIGCAVSTTAVRIARETDAGVVAADISPLMRERAEHAVRDTEFYWRGPTKEAREVFLGQACPGLRFDSVDDWVAVYGRAGLGRDPDRHRLFAMMTLRGFVRDDGWHAAALCARVLSRPAYLRKMVWLMPRTSRAAAYLGYIVVLAREPRVPAEAIAG